MTISVVIPNYNRASLIGETLENLLGQSRAPDEVIVVDDGSTDASVEVIGRFGDRVRLIRQENAGPAKARNRGLAEATGEFIQFFDSDDLCSRNKLEVQAAALERTGADFAYGPWLQARLEGGLARYPELALQQRALPDDRSALSWFLHGWVIVFQCCMFRRSLLDKVGPYRTDLMPSEDSELLCRILLSGARPVHVPEALVLYRLHDGAQISRGGMAAQRRAADWLKYCTIVAEAIAQAPSGVSAADRAQWQWSVWDARRQYDRAFGSTDQAAATPFPQEIAFQLKALHKRLRAGLGRRTIGSSLPRPYRPGRLSAVQENLIRAIGYEPTLDPTAQG
ncbi:glycosyltransferase family 2 protein [Novosphingobium flavum]|uniref:Glycosyltransferase family 2 protein n=1 Tax=Novosphingobium flavum TaxID=1778672 RepID=A0A7X1FPE4_9SPHN|nr:glycosyltransferase family 2 protein [Novosphingobium flavum]MBC2664433.1 glycosyltransferase family 2 protein [Novosphingobium flavum]